MPNIHMVLQGKGGVGKSFIATIIAQYKIHQGRSPLCLDIDPVNSTFTGFKALNVQHINVMENDEINPRHFDKVMETIAISNIDFIVDSGASSFVPLCHYLRSQHVPVLLQEMQYQLVIHTVVTGGQAFMDTINGFAHLAEQFAASAAPFVVWLNSYWGPVEHDGKSFEQLKAYKDYKDHVAAFMRMPTFKRETYGCDLSTMLQQRLTFAEALALPTYTLMMRQRLKIIRDQLYAQLAHVALLT